MTCKRCGAPCKEGQLICPTCEQSLLDTWADVVQDEKEKKEE